MKISCIHASKDNKDKKSSERNHFGRNNCINMKILHKTDDDVSTGHSVYSPNYGNFIIVNENRNENESFSTCTLYTTKSDTNSLTTYFTAGRDSPPIAFETIKRMDEMANKVPPDPWSTNELDFTNTILPSNNKSIVKTMQGRRSRNFANKNESSGSEFERNTTNFDDTDFQEWIKKTALFCLENIFDKNHDDDKKASCLNQNRQGKSYKTKLEKDTTEDTQSKQNIIEGLFNNDPSKESHILAFPLAEGFNRREIEFDVVNFLKSLNEIEDYKINHDDDDDDNGNNNEQRNAKDIKNFLTRVF